MVQPRLAEFDVVALDTGCVRFIKPDGVERIAVNRLLVEQMSRAEVAVRRILRVEVE